MGPLSWLGITNLVNFLWRRFAELGPTLLWRIAAAAGIGIGTYTLALPVMIDFIQGYLNDLPSWAVQLLGALHVDDGLTMLFSAYGAKLGIRVKAIRLNAPTTP